MFRRRAIVTRATALCAAALAVPALAACEGGPQSGSAAQPGQGQAQSLQGSARPTVVASPPRPTAAPAGAASPAGAGATTTAGASGASGTSAQAGATQVTNAGGAEPQHIQVQHVLVGFTGSIPGKPITRTRDEARTLAYDILKRAQGGEDFDGLVRQYTDDSPPGIYGMSNRGVAPASGEYPRDGMVGAFGNVGFTLTVGGIGVADYDPRTSPYGYHIIKRLK